MSHIKYADSETNLLNNLLASLSGFPFESLNSNKLQPRIVPIFMLGKSECFFCHSSLHSRHMMTRPRASHSRRMCSIVSSTWRWAHQEPRSPGDCVQWFRAEAEMYRWLEQYKCKHAKLTWWWGVGRTGGPWRGGEWGHQRCGYIHSHASRDVQAAGTQCQGDIQECQVRCTSRLGLSGNLQRAGHQDWPVARRSV